MKPEDLASWSLRKKTGYALVAVAVLVGVPCALWAVFAAVGFLVELAVVTFDIPSYAARGAALEFGKPVGYAILGVTTVVCVSGVVLVLTLVSEFARLVFELLACLGAWTIGRVSAARGGGDA